MISTTMGGAKLAEGKTKVIYAWPDDPALAEMEHKDAITAGDGARHHTLVDKSVWSCRTMDRCFHLLQQSGIPTHYVRRLDDRHTLVRRCAMIPVEVVARRLATGSYLKRHPEIREGTSFDPPLVELFLKNDALHDPLTSPAELVGAGVATAAEVAAMEALVLRVFAVLEHAWAHLSVTLVDMKIECGRDVNGNLVVADVIDNDSWRLWPGGQRAAMLDKQVYRNFTEVTDEGLARVAANYARVAALTDRFAAG
jgi:phosphoribosylaminoimidazole-succinocarboxamide synthase